jgi:hypothetical protein
MTRCAQELARHAQHTDSNALCHLLNVCQHLKGQTRENLGFAMLLLLKYETKDGVWAIIEQVRSPPPPFDRVTTNHHRSN